MRWRHGDSTVRVPGRNHENSGTCMELVWSLYGICMELLWNITGASPEQPRSNLLATRQKRANLKGSVWVVRRPETVCPPAAALPSCRAQCRLPNTQHP